MYCIILVLCLNSPTPFHKRFKMYIYIYSNIVNSKSIMFYSNTFDNSSINVSGFFQLFIPDISTCMGRWTD